MRRAIIIMGFAMIAAGVRASSTEEFYSDGSIGTGEYWSLVLIHDTPPNHTTVNMTGGWVDTGGTYDTSIFNMTGGKMYHLFSYESSTANLSGNDHSNPFAISAEDNSIINFSGIAKGSEVYVLNAAMMNITGGAIQDLSAYNSGVINIYAGDIFDVWAQDNTTVNIFGHDLIKTSTGGPLGWGYVQGIYNNQSSFNIYFSNSDAYSHVNLIPEPVTILLLGVGGLFLRKKD
jgi:hypothetical protein